MPLNTFPTLGWAGQMPAMLQVVLKSHGCETGSIFHFLFRVDQKKNGLMDRTHTWAKKGQARSFEST